MHKQSYRVQYLGPGLAPVVTRAPSPLYYSDRPLLDRAILVFYSDFSLQHQLRFYSKASRLGGAEIGTLPA